MNKAEEALQTRYVKKQVSKWEAEREQIIEEYNALKKEHPTLFCRKTVGRISGLTFKITNIKRKHNAQMELLNNPEGKEDNTLEIRQKLGLE